MQTQLTDKQTDDGEWEDLTSSIAQGLAELSLVEETPRGFKSPTGSFEPEDVEFDGPGWLHSLHVVQGWLRLPSQITPDAIVEDPIAVASELVTSLGGGSVTDLLLTDGGIPKLTLQGADLIATRVASAVSLQQSFAEALEEGSRDRATEIWAELWEEEELRDPDLDAEPVRAKTTSWPINQFADRARKGQLNLNPTYQRGDVWSPTQSRQLIESILRGIPLPSVILLRAQQGAGKGIYEVVDGKQRLTAILRFMGQHPEAIGSVNSQQGLIPDEVGLERMFREDYRKFKRLWKTHFSERLTAPREAELYFPFSLAAERKLPTSLKPFAGKYYCEIKEESVTIGERVETIEEVFETVSEYLIPLIEYIDAKPRQIHEVFKLYNKQGKHLNAEEIRNALYHELDIMRLLLVTSGDSEQFDILADYLDAEERKMASEIGEILTNYRFGVSRYRRTKLLSWLTAWIMQPMLKADGRLQVRSTAKHIDELLLSVEREADHPLRSRRRLRQLLCDIHACVEAHQPCASWDDAFKDDKDGRKWQELQLVASLVGVFLMNVVQDDVIDLLEAHHDAILEFTASHHRPEKTQNATQWGYIGTVSLGLLDVVGLDQGRLDAELVERFGVSCLPTLRAARASFGPERS